MDLEKWDPITNWDPFRELDAMSGRLDRLFGMRRANMETVAKWSPAVDVTETEKEFVIKAELPEVKKEDIEVTVEEGVLTFRGERKAEKEEKGKKFHSIERSYGSFLRSFAVPDDVDAAMVAAEVKDGVLTIRLPRTEKAKAKSTEVKIT